MAFTERSDFCLLFRILFGGIRFGADHADSETWSGEGLARSDFFIQAEHAGNAAHLILVPIPVRLDYKSAFSCTANHVNIIVMRLDLVRVSADVGISAFDQIGAESALRKEGVVKIDAELGYGVVSYLYEHASDDLTLHFGVGRFGERSDLGAVSVRIDLAVEKFLFRVDALHIYKSELVGIFTYEVAFVLSHKTVIDMYCKYIFRGQSLDEKSRRYGAVYASGNENYDFVVSHALAYHLHRGFYAVFERICIAERTYFSEKVLKHLYSVFGEIDFGVELKRDYVFLFGPHNRGGFAGFCAKLESVGKLCNRIAVAHEDELLFLKPVKERAGGVNGYFRLTVLRSEGGLYDASEVLADKLHSVAYAEHRNSEREYLFIVFRRTGSPYGRRTAGENYRLVAFKRRNIGA